MHTRSLRKCRNRISDRPSLTIEDRHLKSGRRSPRDTVGLEEGDELLGVLDRRVDVVRLQRRRLRVHAAREVGEDRLA